MDKPTTTLQPILTLQTAKAIVNAAEKKATQLGLSLVLSVVDQHGNLKIFRRMDGTNSGSVQVSQQKAFTAASFPTSTRALAERSGRMNGNPYGGGAISGFLLLEGGEPIFDADGNHVGGFGVSGATAEIDGEVARAGIQSLAPDLKSTKT